MGGGGGVLAASVLKSSERSASVLKDNIAQPNLGAAGAKIVRKCGQIPVSNAQNREGKTVSTNQNRKKNPPAVGLMIPSQIPD